MDLETIVRQLVDKKEIEDLITWRFARAIDWIDVESAKACFHEDGIFSYDDITLNGREFCETWGKVATALKMRWHFMGNAGVALQGDRASGEAYAIYAATRDDPESGRLKDYMVACRYLSEVERRAGVWRILSLKVVFDWSIGQDTPERTSSGNTYDRGLDVSHPLFRKLDPLTAGRVTA